MVQGDEAAKSRLIAAWRNTEAYLKQAERYCGKAIIPTVNELRYAGTHIIDGIEGRDPDGFEKATAHCCRGAYDAVEVRLWFLLDRGDKLLQQIETAQITPQQLQVPDFDYNALFDEADATRDLFRQRENDVALRPTSDDDGHVNVDLDLDYLERARQATRRLEELLKPYKRVQAALSRECKILEAAEARARKSHSHTKWMGVATIVSILVAVAALARDCTGVTIGQSPSPATTTAP